MVNLICFWLLSEIQREYQRTNDYYCNRYYICIITSCTLTTAKMVLERIYLLFFCHEVLLSPSSSPFSLSLIQFHYSTILLLLLLLCSMLVKPVKMYVNTKTGPVFNTVTLVCSIVIICIRFIMNTTIVVVILLGSSRSHTILSCEKY